jgi:hypothetical protein
MFPKKKEAALFEIFEKGSFLSTYFCRRDRRNGSGAGVCDRLDCLGRSSGGNAVDDFERTL